MLKPDSIAGKSFFGATREELPAPRNRVKVGTIVALVEVGAQRGHTATVTEVCPGGKIRFADGDVTESCDQYHLCVYDAVGRWIYSSYAAQRHEFKVLPKRLVSTLPPRSHGRVVTLAQSKPPTPAVKSEPRAAKEGLVCLTADEFRELDILARTDVGCALEVMKQEDMGSSVARMNYMVGCGYKDAANTEGDGCMVDLSIIQVVNQIDMDEIGTWPRPELDYGGIPVGDIFRFAVLHEIGHYREDYDWLEAINLLPKERRWVKLLNEVLRFRG